MAQNQVRRMLEQVGTSKMARIAEKAWQRPELGEMHIDGHRVVKDETMVTVVQDNSGIRTTRHIAVFSRPEDFGTFKAAYASVHKPTVTFDHQEAIGTGCVLGVTRHTPVMTKPLPKGMKPEETEFLELFFVQANYKLKKMDPNGLDPEKARQYGGWRLRALQEARRQSENHGVPLVLPKFSNLKDVIGRADFQRDLKKAMEGHERLENEHYVIFRPKG